ncbi:hypothetical protein F4780DRAFT_771382 [Xylariomycetidae sp. FL0641]|nr:hypothetical protein F4780DRAFT_771382 [Xylariomycetidae sp. FL0641]
MDPQAIIGFAFKLPGGASDEDSLWSIIKSARNVATAWPPNRASIGAFTGPALSGIPKLSTQVGHFIEEDLDVFDAPFFSIPAQEAAAMDPQQRWVLETAYHAFENAGIRWEDLRGSRTAVFTSSMSDDYVRTFAKDPDTMPRTTITGTAPSILANRVSWFFDLTGPSMQIDSACSSSMLALDMACQALQNGGASQALVIGSSIMLNPENSLMLSNMGFLSPDGLSSSFDHRANGYGRGEGVIAMMVKPISSSLRDGNTVRAVIRSVCSNQDGRTPNITQPSSAAQERLIREVYKKAGLDFAKTRYVEAHGTGTPLGDPIEFEAIERVFGAIRTPEEPLYVGSIKTNIGHLEGGSGLAGVLKAILVLERGLIPSNALFQRMNPAIDAGSERVLVPKDCMSWPTEGPRRVSINSFGFGGSNSHLVLDDAFHYFRDRGLAGLHRCTILEDSLEDSSGYHEKPAATGSKSVIPMPPDRLLIWSAHDEAAIKRMVQVYGPFYDHSIAGNPVALSQLACILTNRRSLMDWRAFAVVGSDECPSLTEPGVVSKPTRASSSVKIAMVFTGQGAQYVDMGLELIHCSAFMDAFKACDAALRSFGGDWSILDELRNGDNIHLPRYSQPICTALQISLVALLAGLGVSPSAVVGHSSGEIAASYAAGALCLESAMKVAFHRGRLASTLAASSVRAEAMISVSIPVQGVQPYLKKVGMETFGQDIHVACVNSPMNCTLSGSEATIDALKCYLDQDQIFAAKVQTGVAYHSPRMLEIAEKYADAMGPLKGGTMPDREVPMISSVTGAHVRHDTLRTAQYWVENLVSPVLFSDAVHDLLNCLPTPDWITDLVEIGPHPALRRPLEDILRQHPLGRKSPRYHAVLTRSKPPVQTLLKAIGQLVCVGYCVKIAEVNSLIPQPHAQDLETWPKQALLSCPKYPFDRSRRYWKASRLAQGYLFRDQVPADTLGAPVADWNPLEPRWRNLLSLESMPWIRDHAIGDTAIYPGSGLLVMAVEAARQISDPQRSLRGFYIREAHFQSPIIVGDSTSEPTEIMVQLRRLRAEFDKVSAWSSVVAVVQVQYDDPKSQVDTEVERTLELGRASRMYKDSAVHCTTKVDSEKFYTHALEYGHNYGKSFQLLEDIRWDGGTVAIARVKPLPAVCQSASLVHSAVIDAAFHLNICQGSKGCSQPQPTYIPQRLYDTWMSAKGWDQPSDSRMRLASVILNTSGSKIEPNIYVYAGDGSPLATLGRLVMTPVHQQRHVNRTGGQRLIHTIEWRPKLSLLTPHQLHHFCHAGVARSDGTEMISFVQQLENVLAESARRTLDNLPEASTQGVPAHLRKYISSIRQLIEKRECPRAFSLTDDGELDVKLSDFETDKPSWGIFPAVAKNLASILDGKKDALELLFDGGLAESHYRDVFEQACDERFRRYIDLASHENPSLRVIEIGAGTGGMTRLVLGALRDLERKTGTSRFSQYDYTDISPSFFEVARTEFGVQRISYKPLDIEGQVSEQCFEEGAYDLVVAGSVLHATSILKNTLSNVRSLLKPGGQLLFFEAIDPGSFCTNFGYGLLPGWWLGRESYRQLSPLVPEERWDENLKAAGFSGTDLILRDRESDSCHLFSVITSTALNRQPSPSQSQPEIPGVDDQLVLANELGESLSSSRILSLQQVPKSQFTEEDILVSLLEIRQPMLSTISDERFEQVKALLKKSTNLLWATSAHEQSSDYPHFDAMKGLLRTVRAESSEKRIVTLAIEGNRELATYAIAGYIRRVLGASMSPPSQSSLQPDSPEIEYIVRNDYLMCGRLVENIPFDDRVQAMISPKLRHEPLGPGSHLRLSIGTVGMLDTLQFREEETSSQELGPEEVEVEAKTWAVSPRDILICLGRVGEEELGWDCAGVVTKVGASCDLKPGDRVGLGGPGSMRTHVRAHSRSVFRIPQAVSFQDAVSCINPGCTAYHCLINVAKLQQGESILIHSAAGSTGQMAVWIAKYRGAEIYATAGSAQKKQLLVERFGIPPSHILYSRNASFAQGISRLTGGRGVDVVLNSLAGDHLTASWNCIAAHGRFIEIGKADIASNSTLPMANFQRNVSFFAVDLHHLATTRPDVVSGLMQKVLGLLFDGSIQYPWPRHIFPVSDIEKAFRAVQGGTHAGRVVVTLSHSDVVPKCLRSRSEWKLDPTATYIVVGGLGGLGRAIALWLADKGARYLILPSRSGISSKAASTAVDEIQSKGVMVATPVCDASSLSELSDALRVCAETMPPIKGCINSAMALQDSLFEAMNHAQWDLTMQSKAQTSCNLDRLLPGPLDFFILLSSISGLYGSVTQCNYAAGCTVQDALARQRSRRGERAISLDIGWMKSIGIIAEREDYQRNRRRLNDMLPIEDEEFFSLLDLCCDPSAEDQFPPGGSRSQTIIGATTPAYFLSRGETPLVQLRNRMFSGLQGIRETKPRRDAQDDDHVAAFRQAAGTEARGAVVTKALVAKLARALGVAPDDVDPARTLSDYGVDSLMAVELRNWFNNDFRAKVSVLDIMGTARIKSIGAFVVTRAEQSV